MQWKAGAEKHGRRGINEIEREVHSDTILKIYEIANERNSFPFYGMLFNVFKNYAKCSTL